MKQVGGRERALFQLAIGDVDHRAVGIAVGDIADRDLLRGKVQSATSIQSLASQDSSRCSSGTRSSSSISRKFRIGLNPPAVLIAVSMPEQKP